MSARPQFPGPWVSPSGTVATADAALAGSYSFVNPVVALCVGVLLGGERLTGWVFVAMPVILLALALILYGRDIVRLLGALRPRAPSTARR